MLDPSISVRALLQCEEIYLLLVQHVELISGAHTEMGVPVVLGWMVVRGPVVDGAIVQGAVVGGAVVGGTFVCRAVVGGSVEGVGVGAMRVMMVGWGGGKPCI